MPCVIGAYKCHPSQKTHESGHTPWKTLWSTKYFPDIAPPKTNMTPENGWFKNKIPFEMVHFQGICYFSGGYILGSCCTQPSHHATSTTSKSWNPSSSDGIVNFSKDLANSFSCDSLGKKNPTRLNNMCTWWFKVTFWGWLSDPFKGLSDLQLGDKKVTLNHLVAILLLQTLAQTNPVKFTEGWFRARCKWQSLLMKIYHSARQKRTFHHVLPLLRQYVAMPCTWTWVSPIIWNHNCKNADVFHQNWKHGKMLLFHVDGVPHATCSLNTWILRCIYAFLIKEHRSFESRPFHPPPQQN